MPLASVAAADSEIVHLLDHPLWGEIRGHGEGDLSAEARAVRLGALIASLEIRHERGDSTMNALASSAAELLDTFPNGDDAAARYRALSLAHDRGHLESSADLAERAGGWRGVRLGAWLQRARFAAAAGDSSHFPVTALNSVAETALTIDSSAEAEAAARQLGQVVRKRPHDWTAITTAVEELLWQLGDR
jgi:hypothetical protein